MHDGEHRVAVRSAGLHPGGKFEAMMVRYIEVLMLFIGDDGSDPNELEEQ